MNSPIKVTKIHWSHVAEYLNASNLFVAFDLRKNISGQGSRDVQNSDPTREFTQRVYVSCCKNIWTRRIFGSFRHLKKNITGMNSQIGVINNWLLCWQKKNFYTPRIRDTVSWQKILKVAWIRQSGSQKIDWSHVAKCYNASNLWLPSTYEKT